ncbi:larval cuticle protein LCP-17 [Cephus cinctus]|uniref:Larval cuticle protein LCP-17 n=1 Tax=Cephus cinctus TaxID=211228 RepID=A0AAJ7BX04_CEPCN|nr:larval cuticle protein LCP-17 [Cephus cinctus]
MGKLIVFICLIALSVSAEISTSPVAILHQESEVNPDGSFFNVWESENGIKVQEQGTLKHVEDQDVSVVNGDVSWTDNDGKSIHLTYVADENGFQPQGEHIPTPHPMPQSVIRALEYIAAHPYVEKDQKSAETST